MSTKSSPSPSLGSAESPEARALALQQRRDEKDSTLARNSEYLAYYHFMCASFLSSCKCMFIVLPHIFRHDCSVSRGPLWSAVAVDGELLLLPIASRGRRRPRGAEEM